MSNKHEEKDEDIVDDEAGAEADQDGVDDVDDVDLEDPEADDDGEADDAEGSDDADEGEDADPSEEEDDDADEGDDESDKDLSAIEQKKRWRRRALAAEAKLKQVKPAEKPSEKPKTPKTGSKRESELINFRLDHPELKSAEVVEIEAFAKAKGVNLETALKSDVIRIMIARNRKKQQQQGGGTSPSRRSVPAKPEKDWSRAGREEIEAEVARRRLASRQGKR